MKKLKCDADKLMMALVVIYIFLPIILFVFGWIKTPIAVVVNAVLIVAAVKLCRDYFDDTDAEISINTNRKFWVIALFVIALWVLFSGIGKFSYQTSDYIVRNPMYRDLQMYKWPVVYDLSKEPELVKGIIGSEGKAIYVYYFTWWLPPALIGRVLYNITNMSVENVEIITDLALYIWAVMGLFLTFYCLVRLLKKYSYLILSSFILFGGLDVVMYFLQNNRFPAGEHIEWWAGGGGCRLFQYSANTTQLYWVFNQSIPVWLIIAAVLLLKNNSKIAAVSSLAFAYSPFATIGLVPIAIAGVFNSNKDSWKSKIRSALSFENILLPVSMLAIFGCFYSLVIGGSKYDDGFIFATDPEFRTFTIYMLFILIEFLVYYFAMGNIAKKYRFYWIVLVDLLLIPMYKMGFNNDFVMRASIPALFILMTFCLRALFEKKEMGNRRGYIVLLALMVVGYMASVCEIRRNVTYTLQIDQSAYINELEYSFGEMRTDSEWQIKLSANQYMADAKEYKYSAFYNILMK